MGASMIAVKCGKSHVLSLREYLQSFMETLKCGKLQTGSLSLEMAISTHTCERVSLDCVLCKTVQIINVS